MKRLSTHIRWATFMLALVLALSCFMPTAFAENYVKASKLSLNKSNITLYVTTVDQDPDIAKHSFQLVPNIQPYAALERAQAQNLIAYTSNKPGVVSVDPVTGKMVAHRTGTATITVRLYDGSNKKSRCYVSVKAQKPTSVSLDCGSELVMEKGTTMRIAATVLPENVKNKGVRFTSSKSSVATVSSSGGVVAKKNGTTKITVTTKSGGKKASVKLTVVTRNTSLDTQYRFYGVANADYDPQRYDGRNYNIDLPACKNDLTYMNKALSYATFNGTRISRVIKRNLTGNGIRNFLNSIADNSAIDDNDVTIFFYTGHGSEDGSLIGKNVNSNAAFVSIGEIKHLLDAIPGTVIVMLDSCYSGQFIQNKSGVLMTPQREAFGALRFNSSWVSALQEGKPASAMSKSLVDPYYARGQYKILTACSPSQLSFAPSRPSTSFTMCSFFTTGLYDSIRLDGSPSMAADVNKDKVVTLSEMFDYSQSVVDRLLNLAGRPGDQTIMVWPQNDNTPVFATN